MVGTSAKITGFVSVNLRAIQAVDIPSSEFKPYTNVTSLFEPKSD